MVKVVESLHQKKKNTLSVLQRDRLPWWKFWRELADYILPRRYVWLLTKDEINNADIRNRKILDATGTTSARTLASGMMNGVTSPARPWFRLRVPGSFDTASGPERVYLDEVQRRMLLVMAESNFYNALAVIYLDLVVFGTSAMLIYDDFEEVIRCYNTALGEFYLAQDHRLQVNTYAREFTYRVAQIVDRWGIDNVSASVRDAFKQGGGRLQDPIKIVHLIEPNIEDDGRISSRFKFREYYWEEGGPLGTMLEVRGFRELPGVFTRWETIGNSAYGSSPCMDALPDVIQLQFETKAKAQGIELMNRPPLLADVQLKNRPTALLPRGVTYVSGANAFGAKPVYTVSPPIAEMGADIIDIRARIREILHNDLFKMISQIDTVRSATEIDARREEKLVLLGPVLERFENEALDPAITRIFAIMERKGMLPDLPPELEGVDRLEIQYVSVLSDAQRAVGTAAHERFAQFVGNLAPVAPGVLNVPNWDKLVRDYGERIGVPGIAINTEEESAELTEGQQASQEAQEAATIGPALTGAAQQLSATDVGGGQNALQQIIGGA